MKEANHGRRTPLHAQPFSRARQIAAPTLARCSNVILTDDAQMIASTSVEAGREGNTLPRRHHLNGDVSYARAIASLKAWTNQRPIFLIFVQRAGRRFKIRSPRFAYLPFFALLTVFLPPLRKINCPYSECLCPYGIGTYAHSADIAATEPNELLNPVPRITNLCDFRGKVKR